MAQRSATKKKPAAPTKGTTKPPAKGTTKRPAAPKVKARAGKVKGKGPAPRAKKAKKEAAPEEESDAGVFPVEVEAGEVEKTLLRLRDELSHWVKKGRYTKVRFKFRGKPILPDLPIGAVIAAEAATFWWTGLLRALLVAVGAKTVLEMELVSDADVEVARGKEALLAGELDKALAAFERAVKMDRDCAAGHLNIGIAQRLKGQRAAAREALERARELGKESAVAIEAERLLKQIEEQEKAEAPVGAAAAPAREA